MIVRPTMRATYRMRNGARWDAFPYMDNVRVSIWLHGPLTQARLPDSFGRHIDFRHQDGFHYQCAVPEVDFEGPAFDVSLLTRDGHQALSISYENLERTYFFPLEKPKSAKPSPDHQRWASERMERGVVVGSQAKAG
jgi:hypothetical protein